VATSARQFCGIGVANLITREREDRFALYGYKPTEAGLKYYRPCLMRRKSSVEPHRYSCHLDELPDLVSMLESAKRAGVIA